jgi:hypothetical protein
MKKIIPILVVFVLVATAVGITWKNPVWAGTNSSPADSPLKVIKTVTENGLYNIGGICTINLAYTAAGYKTIADAEVLVKDSEKVSFNPVPVPGYSQEFLLFPGCRFMHYEMDANKDYQLVDPMVTTDGTAKVCFGASPVLTMSIYYYLENPPTGTKVWIQLPTTLEDQNRLICAPAQHSGVYMPSGKYIIDPSLIPGGGGVIGGGGGQGSVQTPPTEVTITQPGTFAIGGICTMQVKYNIKGLSDVVAIEFANSHMTQDTLTVPPDVVQGVFYFPGCHVVHYLNTVIQDTVTPQQGDWQICFAAIPDKVMTIYYYRDDLTDIVPPWTALESTTQAGKVCADPVDFSAVYAPAAADPPPATK